MGYWHNGAKPSIAAIAAAAHVWSISGTFSSNGRRTSVYLSPRNWPKISLAPLMYIWIATMMTPRINVIYSTMPSSSSID